MPPCASNTTAYESTAATMTADETQLQGGGPGSTFIQPCSSMSSQHGGKRRRKTRKATTKKRRRTKRAGSGMFDTVYDSIFGKQEKPPPKPKKSGSSDEFVDVDVDPSSAPSSTGPGYKGATGLPMEGVIDPSDYDSKDLRILGLGSDPTEKQIKTAYRKKALKCHPDKVKGKLKEFQKLQGANERIMEKYRMKHPKASKKKRTKKPKKPKKPKKTTKRR